VRRPRTWRSTWSERALKSSRAIGFVDLLGIGDAVLGLHARA
jgi:hypothetical protein